MAETQVSIRIDIESGGRIRPGKIALLEAIRETGSITAAAVAMKTSYRRAWPLVDELNKLLSEPVSTKAYATWR
jgi:molybdate transport system regulatory protein